MTRISRLPNIDPAVVATLERHDVTTVEDLWAAIGSDFPKGIKSVVAKTTIDEAQLREIIKQEAVAGEPSSNTAAGRFLFFIGRYWREVLALVIAVVLLTLLIRSAVKRRDTLVVTAAYGLPAFHVIQAGDVEPVRMFRVDDSFAVENDVTGRYLLQPVSPGAVLLKNQLAPAHLKDQLKGREVLTIPVKATAISSTIRPGSTVRVLFSPRNQDAAKTDLIIKDVIVLAINLQGDSSAITVALKNSDDLTKALSLLSTSDVLISEG
ncbi:MAG TPA: SAF domain-containing protein [Pyrinomonadaceae bacterium]|nr:SAF domain-containing protein [Pyrinomonadaceae bacterium]